MKRAHVGSHASEQVSVQVDPIVPAPGPRGADSKLRGSQAANWRRVLSLLLALAALAVAFGPLGGLFGAYESMAPQEIGGYARRHLLGNSGVELEPGELINCNLYNYKDYSFNPDRTKGRYPAKKLRYVPSRSSSDVDQTFYPFQQEAQTAMSRGTIYVVDTLTEGHVSSLLGIKMERFYNEVYESADKYLDKIDALNAIFTFGYPSLVDKYLQNFTEDIVVLAFEKELINHVSAGDRYVAWSFKDRDSEGGGGSPVMSIGVYDTLEQQFPVLSWTRERENGCEDKSEVSRMHPSVCGRWLTYEVYDHADESVSVWLYDLELHSAEQLTSTKNHTHFHPQLAKVTDSEGAHFHNCLHVKSREECESSYLDVECRLMWIETSNPLRVSQVGGRVAARPDTPTGGLSDATIQMIDLPERIWNPPLEASSYLRGPFTELRDVAASGDQVFLLTARPGGAAADGCGAGAGGDAYAIRTHDVLLHETTDLPDAIFTHTVAIHAVSEQGLLLWERLCGGGQRLSAIKLVYLPQMRRQHYTRCLVTDAGNITRATLYKDTVVWTEIPEAGAAGDPRMLLLDVNKDNDLLFDASDRFPFEGQYAFDGDNDDIGDEGDLIRARGGCVESDRRSACTSDIVILYGIWAAYVVAVTLATAYVVRWYKREQAFLAEIDSLRKEDNGAPGGVFDPAARQESEEEEQPSGKAISAAKKLLRLDSKAPTTPSKGTSFDEDGEEDEDEGESAEQKIARNYEERVKGQTSIQVKEDMDRNVRINVVLFSSQLFLLLLTVASLVLVTVPFYSPDRPSIKTMQIFTWTDFFITFLFLVDLVVRYHVRNKASTPNLLRFLRKNWTDTLALFTDIPGVTGAGALHFLVLTRFRHLVRLFRIARILKVFRVVRMYRRITSHKTVIDIMINRPTTFLIILLVLFIFLASAAIKILEQGANPDFSNLTSVVWFVLVTITTVGYGDMVPTNVVSRCITGFLMIIGIGMLGLLTAALLKKLMMGSKGKMELEKLRRERRVRTDMLKMHMQRMTIAYNPLMAVYGEHSERRVAAEDSEIQDINDMHQSRFLNRADALDHEMMTPFEVMMSRGGGKFGNQGVGSTTAGLSEEEFQRRQTAARDHAVLSDMFAVDDEGNSIDDDVPDTVPEVKLIFILKYYKLDHKKTGVNNFERFAEEIGHIIFRPPQENTLFVEKVLSLARAMNSRGEFPGLPDMQDPVDAKLVRLEEVMLRYGVTRWSDYHELMLELICLTYMHDRVDNANWVVKNLSLKPGAKVATPALREVGRYKRVPMALLASNMTFARRKMAVQRAKRPKP